MRAFSRQKAYKKKGPCLEHYCWGHGRIFEHLALISPRYYLVESCSLANSLLANSLAGTSSLGHVVCLKLYHIILLGPIGLPLALTVSPYSSTSRSCTSILIVPRVFTITLIGYDTL